MEIQRIGEEYQMRYFNDIQKVTLNDFSTICHMVEKGLYKEPRLYSGDEKCHFILSEKDLLFMKEWIQCPKKMRGFNLMFCKVKDHLTKGTTLKVSNKKEAQMANLIAWFLKHKLKYQETFPIGRERSYPAILISK